MRIKVGEPITLFDGSGNEAAAVVHTLNRREVRCESTAPIYIDRENQVSLTLGVAMPKGDRAKELVERLTELGVNDLVPLHCQRAQRPVPENAIPKWHRVMIDACKQSGRNQFMQISSPISLDVWLAQSNQPHMTRYLAHAANNDLVSNPVSITSSNVCHIAIGPEGGFSDQELALADANGWQRLPLGNRIYRIETAAILAAIKLARI